MYVTNLYRCGEQDKTQDSYLLNQTMLVFCTQPHICPGLYQCVVPSASAAVCPCRPCRHRLPRSCASVWSAHTRWKEALSLGWSRHSCAAELRKASEQRSKILSTRVGRSKEHVRKCWLCAALPSGRWDIIWTGEDISFTQGFSPGIGTQ